MGGSCELPCYSCGLLDVLEHSDTLCTFQAWMQFSGHSGRKSVHQHVSILTVGRAIIERMLSSHIYSLNRTRRGFSCFCPVKTASNNNSNNSNSNNHSR